MPGDINEDSVVVEIDLEGLRPSRPNDATPISNAQLRKNRTVVTLLHFVLTYPKFSVSLFVLFASLTTPLPTSYERVWRPLSNLQAVVQREAQLYHECVVSGFALHDVRMDRAVKAEQKRAYENHVDVLQPKIAMAAEAVSTCFNATLSAQRALQTWGGLGQAIPRTYNSTRASECTTQDQERLTEMLLEDVTLVHTGVQNIYDAYTNASLVSLRKMVRYSHERGTYDYNYFIGSKIPLMALTIDQFVVPGVSLSFPEQRFLLELRNLLNGLVGAMRVAYEHINVLTIRLAAFEASIQRFHLNFNDLYGRFQLATTFVREFTVGLPPYFDMSNLSLPDAMLPPLWGTPDINVELPSIDALVSQYMEKVMRLVSEFFQEAAEEASEQTQRVIQELLALLEELTLLDDYFPPQYPYSPGIQSPDDELAFLEKFAVGTKAKATAALDELKRRSQHLGNYKPVTPDVDVVPPTLGERDQTSFSFLDLRYPSLAAPIWMTIVFGYICSHTFLIECLTQAIRLYRLKKKYETNASPDLPEIDYAEDDDKREDENSPSKMQVAQAMVLKHIVNPWVICGLSIVPIVLVILLCWFPHVKRSCIDTRNGTFLARNILTQVQVNRANSQGYSVHMIAQQNCYIRQRSLCDLMSSQADAEYRQDAAKLASLQASFNESNNARGVMARCVDVRGMDEQFESCCCGLEGYASDECSPDQSWQLCPIDGRPTPPSSFRPVGESLADPACTIDMEGMNNNGAQFNCTVLEDTCHDVPCKGVDANLIEEMTIEADCSAEIFAIQLCVFLALALFHAVMINWANTLMFTGLLQVRWKSLKPEGIKMITHVNLNGDLVKGGDLQERTDRVNQAMKRYEIAGYVQIGLSIVVFVIWLVAFLLLRKAATRLDMYHT